MVTRSGVVREHSASTTTYARSLAFVHGLLSAATDSSNMVVSSMAAGPSSCYVCWRERICLKQLQKPLPAKIGKTLPKNKENNGVDGYITIMRVTQRRKRVMPPGQKLPTGSTPQNNQHTETHSLR